MAAATKVHAYCPACGKRWKVDEDVFARGPTCKRCKKHARLLPVEDEHGDAAAGDGVDDSKEQPVEVVPQPPPRLEARRCFHCARELLVNPDLEAAQIVCGRCGNLTRFSNGNMQTDALVQAGPPLFEFMRAWLDGAPPPKVDIPARKRPDNYCAACGYYWVPRGYHLSSSCPKCSSAEVCVVWIPYVTGVNAKINVEGVEDPVVHAWWELETGELPTGMCFDRDDGLGGLPLQEGAWTLTLRLSGTTQKGEPAESKSMRVRVDTARFPSVFRPDVIEKAKREHATALEESRQRKARRGLLRRTRTYKQELRPLHSKSGIPRNQCRLCGHHWTPRGSDLSARCPNCGKKDGIGYVMVPKSGCLGLVLLCALVVALLLVATT